MKIFLFRPIPLEIMRIKHIFNVITIESKNRITFLVVYMQAKLKPTDGQTCEVSLTIHSTGRTIMFGTRWGLLYVKMLCVWDSSVVFCVGFNFAWAIRILVPFIKINVRENLERVWGTFYWHSVLIQTTLISLLVVIVSLININNWPLKDFRRSQ